MEILTLPLTTVNDDREFVVAIPEQEVSERVSPFMLGVLDAEQGISCTPEMYFLNRGHQCEYCEGYESVAGANFTTMQFLPKRVRVLTETEDLIEGRLDNEYWSRGGW